MLASLFRFLRGTVQPAEKSRKGSRISGSAPTPARNWIPAWADYARAQYDSAAERVTEFRNWARQLAAAIAVVIGLEVDLLIHTLFDVKRPFNLYLLIWSLTILLSAIAWQLRLLPRLIRSGYVGTRRKGPESPMNRALLLDLLEKNDEVETKRVLGAYYGKGFEELHPLGEQLAIEVKDATERFAKSLWLLFCGCVGLVFLVLSPSLGI